MCPQLPFTQKQNKPDIQYLFFFTLRDNEDDTQFPLESGGSHTQVGYKKKKLLSSKAFFHCTHELKGFFPLHFREEFSGLKAINMRVCFRL